jgi:allantoicase
MFSAATLSAMAHEQSRLDETDPAAVPLDPDGLPMAELSSRHLGAGVVSASDESFGNKEHLLTPEPADFVPGTYDHRGEVVDGWETRRRREPGHDWAVVRLGLPGIIRRVDIDTSFFTGNFPETCWLEACGLEGYPGPAELATADWEPLVPLRQLKGDVHNLVEVTSERRYTHVRLSIAPDGGVARLRVHGRPVVDPRLFDGVTVDLASQQLGARVVRSSDNFYGSAQVLTRPDRARTMGEGWETRRRRDDGNDWALIQLAARGELRQVELDTMHFKHNASSHVEVRAIDVRGFTAELEGDQPGPDWTMVLPRVALQPDTRHVYPVFPLDPAGRPVTQAPSPASYVRVDAFPDGGLSRVRVIGRVSTSARVELGLAWFNSLPGGQARRVLTGTGLSADAADAVVGRRPFSTLEEAMALDGGLAALLGGPGENLPD